MSVKSQFLKKLQARQPVPVAFTSKTQADIAAFRQRMAQLQEQMDAWLTGTGLNVESFTASVTDLLVEGGAFDIPGWKRPFTLKEAYRHWGVYLCGQVR